MLIQANTTNSASYANFPGGIGNDQLRFREAFVQAGNVIKSNPDAKFWAGERFYRRYHIDINDFYILDMSGYGAGVEDFNVKFAKLSAGFSGGRAAGYRHEHRHLRQEQHRCQALRHESTGRTSRCLVQLCNCKGRHSAERHPHSHDRWLGSGVPSYPHGIPWRLQEFAVGYAKGAASNLGTSLDDPTRFLKHAEKLLIQENFLIQPNPKFAIMPLFIYQRTRNGNPQDGPAQWYSFGARPQFFFTNHVSLALEPGFDRSDRW